MFQGNNLKDTNMKDNYAQEKNYLRGEFLLMGYPLTGAHTKISEKLLAEE